MKKIVYVILIICILYMFFKHLMKFWYSIMALTIIAIPVINRIKTNGDYNKMLSQINLINKCKQQRKRKILFEFVFIIVMIAFKFYYSLISYAVLAIISLVISRLTFNEELHFQIFIKTLPNDIEFYE